MRITLVCLGNICRSPMAEVVLREGIAEAGLSDRVTVDSAGTGNWHVGEPMDTRARAALAAAGYDGSGHRARQFEPSWYEETDLVLAMDRSNLADLEAMPGAHDVKLFGTYGANSIDQNGGEVPDPWTGGPEGFDHVLRLVEKASNAIIEELRATV